MSDCWRFFRDCQDVVVPIDDQINVFEPGVTNYGIGFANVGYKELDL